MLTTILLTLSVVTSGYSYPPTYYYPPPVVKFFAVEPNHYYLDIVSGGQRQDQQRQTVQQFIQALEQFNATVKQRDVAPVDPDDVPIPVLLRKPVSSLPPPIEVVSFLKNDCMKCHSDPKPTKGFKIFEANGQMSILTGEQKVKIDAAIANRDMPPNQKDLTGELPKYREWIYQDPAVLEFLKKRLP